MSDVELVESFKNPVDKSAYIFNGEHVPPGKWKFSFLFVDISFKPAGISR